MKCIDMCHVCLQRNAYQWVFIRKVWCSVYVLCLVNLGSQVRSPAFAEPLSMSLRVLRHKIHTQTKNPPGPVLVTTQEKA